MWVFYYSFLIFYSSLSPISVIDIYMSVEPSLGARNSTHDHVLKKDYPTPTASNYKLPLTAPSVSGGLRRSTILSVLEVWLA